MKVAVRHILKVAPDHYELETSAGERVGLMYNGVALTALYRSSKMENLSFSVERRGLSGLNEFLDFAGFEVTRDCMMTLEG